MKNFKKDLEDETQEKIDLFNSFCKAIIYSLITIREKDRRPDMETGKYWLKPILGKFKSSKQRTDVFHGLLCQFRDFWEKSNILRDYRGALTPDEMTSILVLYLAPEDPKLVMNYIARSVRLLASGLKRPDEHYDRQWEKASLQHPLFLLRETIPGGLAILNGARELLLKEPSEDFTREIRVTREGFSSGDKGAIDFLYEVELCAPFKDDQHSMRLANNLLENVWCNSESLLVKDKAITPVFELFLKNNKANANAMEYCQRVLKGTHTKGLLDTKNYRRALKAMSIVGRKKNKEAVNT